MTQQQFIEEIKQLSVKERIALIEAISRSLREDFASHGEGEATARSESESTEDQGAEQTDIPLSRRLYGILKFEGDPPTDEEIKDAYTDYLMEKYS